MAESNGKRLVREAVEDAKAIRDAAYEAAKRQVVEELAPGIRQMIESKIRTELGEGANRMRRVDQGYPGESQSKFEESKEKGESEMEDEKMESLAGFFPSLSEMDGGEEPEIKDESGIPQLEEPKMDDDYMKTEKKGGDEEGAPEEPACETVEIANEALEEFYQAALQTEVNVKKGFSDFTGGGELDDASKDTGILDAKSGEHEWEKEEPPAKQKFIPESLKKMIVQGLEENKRLRAENAQLKGKLSEAISTLHETNLFNHKVLHVNQLLNRHAGLTKEQKKLAIESLDRAKSIDEVKNIFEILTGTLSTASKLSESTTRKPAANAQRVRTSGAPRVLSESDERAQGEGNARWKQLAGLVK